MWLLNNKVLVKESGILEGFCDCHCHLLPGVDDGVKEMKESMQILEKWDAMGVKEVWLTPHIMEDMPNKTADLKGCFEAMNAQFEGALKLHLAAENMLDNLFAERIATDDFLPIGNNGQRLLIETSYYNPPMDMARTIDLIKGHGYTPILAHPERYQYMNIADYKRWTSKEVKLQLNVPSLVGAYGPEVQAKAKMLMDKGMYDYCGTDTHSKRFVEYFLNSKISKKTVKEVNRIVENMEL